MLNIIVVVLVFGLVILIHEFGHFLLAKMNGIGVLEFSLGMGPRLASFQRGETRYSLKALPFGGSCMMLGEDENEADERAFNNKSVWARISVIAAGPVFNFILAFLFAMVIVNVTGFATATVDSVMNGYPAQEAGLKAGDVITRLNGRRITTYEDVQLYVLTHPGEPLKITYRRADPDTGKMAKAETTLVPRFSKEQNSYLMGVLFSAVRQKPTSIGQNIYYSADQVGYVIRSTFYSLRMLFRGQVNVGEAVAGPLRIVTMMSETVQDSREVGFGSVLFTLSYWALILSASLGIMNLLPIPALDGGRLVFLVIEAVRGKPIDREKEGMVHMAGMMFLMALMVFVLFNDIRSLL